MNMITTFMGKPLEELTREELIKAINDVMKARYDSAGYVAESKIRDLEKEIEIKNDVIERLIKK